MVGAVVVVPLVLGYLGPDALVELLVQAGRWPVLALVLLVALMVLYRYGPSRRPPGWRWLSVGALVALVLWLIGSSLLSWYLSNFGKLHRNLRIARRRDWSHDVDVDVRHYHPGRCGT
jgi:membrane protein